MVAVFTVSAGYGVVLPLLPYRIERLIGAGTQVVQTSRNVGLVAFGLTAAESIHPFAYNRALQKRFFSEA
jgi:hypothetical protein